MRNKIDSLVPNQISGLESTKVQNWLKIMKKYSNDGTCN